MRKLDTIVVHHSDMLWGDVKVIRKIHVEERGWTSIGYHFIILNEFPTYESLRDKKPLPDTDGLIQTGRLLELIGAHAKGHNLGSVGICLIGKTEFTAQQFKALRKLITRLLVQYPSIKRICGHRDLCATECPTFDVAKWWLSGKEKDGRRTASPL